ncbi:two-component system sensor histidine kinase DesK [Luteibacter sp. Sphag1AF]|uniref:sensor histidine kinase n=1 Tax=Luteibacter sp. Sphag1AF TaxID=2587031 RepID=UPI001610F715|nr:sensor histidine kinase [Luteibacter sp. Sphag1AF]MBB3228948.1 two-component system sensor histidine kinase DesK [Luteibacter sp. Sphag1AF]
MKRLFTPTPDSLLGSLGSPYLRLQAGLQVFWVVALIQVPLSVKGFAWGWFAPTLLTIPIYLWCTLRILIGPMRQIPIHAVVIGALGVALWSLNPVGVGYLLIASGVIAYTGRINVWFWGLVGFTGLTTVLMFVSGENPARIAVVAVGGGFGGFANYLYVRTARNDMELRLSQAEVRRLATVTERERIGRDLHDLLGHTLSLITLKSELARRLALADPERARQEMEEVERVARHTLAEVRAAVTGLRVGDLRAEVTSARLMLEASGISFVAQLPDAIVLADTTQAALSLVVREAITNIHRHSRATAANISVTREDNVMYVRIIDNGCGGVAAHGNGISGMRERVRALGGTLRMESPARKGTSIDIVVPVVAQPGLEHVA